MRLEQGEDTLFQAMKNPIGRRCNCLTMGCSVDGVMPRA
jgi:hypothetical protein